MCNIPDYMKNCYTIHPFDAVSMVSIIHVVFGFHSILMCLCMCTCVFVRIRSCIYLIKNVCGYDAFPCSTKKNSTNTKHFQVPVLWMWSVVPRISVKYVFLHHHHHCCSLFLSSTLTLLFTFNVRNIFTHINVHFARNERGCSSLESATIYTYTYSLARSHR